MQAIQVLQSSGREVRGLLKRARIYEDSYLPKKTGTSILLPVRDVPSKVFAQVREAAPEAVLVEADLRKNRRTRSFRRELQTILPKEVYNEAARAYEQVGEVGIITVFESMQPFEQEIAQALMETNKGIRLVLNKAGRHAGDDRVQNYEVLAGDGSSRTVHKENGVELEVDVQEAYYSSRTFEERRRVAQLVRSDERVLVLFSGVAPYVCVIAKNTDAKLVYGIEQNEQAHTLALANVARNELDNTQLFCGDVREVLPGIGERFERIILPHPTEADYFFPDALAVAADSCSLHLYVFLREEKLSAVEERLRLQAREHGFVITSFEVREQFHLSPQVSKYCFDISVARTN